MEDLTKLLRGENIRIFGFKWKCTLEYGEYGRIQLARKVGQDIAVLYYLPEVPHQEGKFILYGIKPDMKHSIIYSIIDGRLAA